MQDESQSTDSTTNSGADSGADSGTDLGGGGSGVSSTAPAPDVLIRRLDRLVAGTDAHVLRSGFTEGAAPASLSFDALEARLRFIQSQMRLQMQGPPAPAGGEPR